VNKVAVLTRIQSERVIGLVRGDVGGDLLACAEALSRGGINCLEVAMTTPAAIDALGAAHEKLPEFHFGLGTVLDVETARRAILAGASFLVTPAPRPAVITLCRRYHVPVISGAFTSTDITTAQEAGADAVKVFPADQFGPAYIKTLKEAHSEGMLIPIGGVTPDTVAEFLRAGATAVFAGSSLIDDEVLKDKRWEQITERARKFIQASESV
jgi:2-dehydro-3-deoxyphosphogluconate aldolase/(4S)-4-hydroxy-2-oxoglutarate aldolase